MAIRRNQSGVGRKDIPWCCWYPLGQLVCPCAREKVLDSTTRDEVTRAPDTSAPRLIASCQTRPDRFSFQTSRIQKHAFLPIVSARECRVRGSLWILQSNGIR